jgi:hypothetical protein
VKVPRDAFGFRPQAFPRDFHKPPSVCGRFNHYILKNHGITYNKIAVCEKTAGLRSGNFSDLNSACSKVLVPVKIFQFRDR